MENEGAQNNNNSHDPSLAFRNDEMNELLWDYQEYDMDALLADYVNGGTENVPEGGKENSPGTSSKLLKRRNVQQIQELEALYQICAHPDGETHKMLAARIGMDVNQVKIWFQNRRSQNKLKECGVENNKIRSSNAALQAENAQLRQRILEKSCLSCVCRMAHSEPSAEKQLLLIENARLKEECLRAEAILGKLSRGGAVLPPHLQSIVQDGQGDSATLLRQHAERAMKEFQTLATTGVPMWLPSVDGEVFNYREYSPEAFPRLFGPCPEGFVVEATREEGIVRGTTAYLVGILNDTSRWSEMFPGIVAAVTAQDVGSGGILAPRDGLLRLMNAELWMQSPRIPNRSLNFLRFTKLMENGRQWAVMDVSVSGILADGQGGRVGPPAEHMRCWLLPSGCLIEDLGNGYCKVTWIVHAEYDESIVPPLFRPLFRAGQALGARRWLASLQRQCEYMGIRKNCPVGDGRKGVMEVAQRMTASFYAAVSGPVTLPASNVIEWRGSSGNDIERFDAAVRMVTWNCAGSVPGQPGDLVLSATTTVWLPSTQPQLVFDYLRDVRRRGEWDTLTNGTAALELGTILTGYLHGNAISILRPNVTNGTNKKMLILQEACSDASCSLVVYSPMDEEAMLDIMNGGDYTSVFLLPSGFAILPDGHRKAPHVPPSAAASSSNAHNNTSSGCLLTAGCQTMWPGGSGNLSADVFDAIGKLLCVAIENIKTAVHADIIIPA